MRRAWLALCCAAGLGLPVMAQPNLAQRTGLTVAETGVTGWRFKQFRLASADGLRRYRVRVAVPDAVPPSGGYASAWLLDGNAALMETGADFMASLAGQPRPPVLVYIGYDNDLRITADARAYDYTPRRAGGEQAQGDAVPGRLNGGADAFLEVISRDVLPRVEEIVPLDPARRTLWGHSYGGVFVLHALATKTNLFSTYAAADPSLWWGEAHLLREEFSDLEAPLPRLRLWTGSGGASGDAAAAAPGRDPEMVAALRAARASAPADALLRLVERLRARGLEVRHDQLEGLSHGMTLGESLRQLLAGMAREEGR
jgi:predicted alpha/beta superfamily hydrolase